MQSLGLDPDRAPGKKNLQSLVRSKFLQACRVLSLNSAGASVNEELMRFRPEIRGLQSLEPGFRLGIGKEELAESRSF